MTALASQGKETLAILRKGYYETSAARRVDIHDAVAKSIEATRLYRPDDFPSPLTAPNTESRRTTFEVTNETTLAAARRLTSARRDEDILCLNFASAKTPGGGFLGGARAQEESLARSSALYATLEPMREMYDYNRRQRTCLYSGYMIHSPGVPVFRDDSGRLLDDPYRVSFLTAPAVNAGAVKRNEPENVPLIESTMTGRVDKMLWVAASHRHSVLVLGAWGCGVFRNDPEMIAGLFHRSLTGVFEGVFEHVIFAVLDTSRDGSVIGPFRAAFDHLT